MSALRVVNGFILNAPRTFAGSARGGLSKAASMNARTPLAPKAIANAPQLGEAIEQAANFIPPFYVELLMLGEFGPWGLALLALYEAYQAWQIISRPNFAANGWSNLCTTGTGNITKGFSQFCNGATDTTTLTKSSFDSYPFYPWFDGFQWKATVLEWYKDPHPVFGPGSVQIKVRQHWYKNGTAANMPPWSLPYLFPLEVPNQMPIWMDPNPLPFSPAAPPVPVPYPEIPHRFPDPFNPSERGNDVPERKPNNYPRYRPRPDLSPNPWNSNALSPATGEAGPGIEISYSPGKGVEVSPVAPPSGSGPKPEPPGPETKEKKKYVKFNGSPAHVALGTVTEGLDLINDLYNSLPASMLRNPKNCKKIPRTFPQKLRMVLQNADKIDFDAAVINIASSQIKDAAYAAGSRAVGKAASNMGMSRGPEFGGSSNRKNMSDLDKEINRRAAEKEKADMAQCKGTG